MFSVFDDVPEIVIFFWEPPPPDQRNGIIIGYNIVCMPTDDGQPVSFTFAADGIMSGTLNATVGMFTPATQYNCAITASTRAGPGPTEARNVITCKKMVLSLTYAIKLYSTEFSQSN